MPRDFNREILNEVAHRPWPLPDGPWLMTQTWNDLLFAHWPVDPSGLREHVPDAFPLDLFEGRSWVGVVPFVMTNVGPRGVPSLPWVSEFPELNVRTYVRAGGKPGVFFFSLDAGSLAAVTAARALLNLPYYSASMEAQPWGDGISYKSVRSDTSGARFEATYQPEGRVFAPHPGTLDYFLTERYCLYHLDHRGHPYRLDIHHPLWPLQHAQASIAANRMLDVHRLTPLEPSPLLHFAKRQDMVAWAPQRL